MSYFRSLCLSLAFILIPIHLVPAQQMFRCKPLPFYRFRADERKPYQFNRLAAVDPFVVRLIYFIPSDRSFLPEVPIQLDALIRNAQAFYADEMQARGSGRKTFAFETDTLGQAIVHPIDGQFPDSHYRGANTSDNVEAEIETQFSLEDNIYLVAVDVSDEVINGAGGVGGPKGPNGGVAYVPASGLHFDFVTVTHELGHAFGLQHDFNDDAFIMSYGDSPDRLSACSAELLDVNRFFNPGGVFVSEAEPSIRIISPFEYPSGASSITIRVELSDSDGLHQAQFLPITTDFANEGDRVAAVGSPEVQNCVSLNGQNATVEFSYTRLAGGDAHRLAIGVVDRQGEAELKEFSVFSETRVGQTLRIAQSGGADFTSIAAALQQALPRDRIELIDNGNYNETVQILENFISLVSASGSQPTLATIVTFGSIGLTLENLNVREGVFVQDGADVTIRESVIESSQSGILITDASKAMIESNHIRNAQNGVTVQNNSEATIRENQITDNREAAIAVLASTATINDNDVQRNGNSIFIQDGSEATLINNRIVQTLATGVVVSGSIVTLTENEIAENAERGISIQSNAEFTIQNNRLLSNGTGGIFCSNSVGDLIGNTISQNKGSGVQWDGTTGTIADNTIVTNDDGDANQQSDHGVVISGAPQPVMLKDNTIEESGTVGVLILESDVHAEGNTIGKNGGNGIAAQNGSNLDLIGNTITDNQDTGVVISDATDTILIHDNVVSRNGAGIFIFTSPQVILINNLISRSQNTDGHGVVLQGSSGRLINNTIAFNNVGLLVFKQVRTPKVEVVNTLFAENQTDVANFSQATADSFIRHSFLSDVSFIGRDGNIGGAPRFVDAAGDDFRLSADSPAINAGDSNTAELPEFDLDGVGRIAGVAVDIGAYEFGGETPVPTFHEFQLEFPEGISLRHLPLLITHINDLPRQMERISDLYDVLGGDENVHQLITYNSQKERFQTFSQFEVEHATALDALAANIPLAPHTGVIAIMKHSVTLKLRGDAPEGVVSLEAGINLAGLPLQSDDLSRIRDLVQLPELLGNVEEIFSYDGQRFNRFDPEIDLNTVTGDLPIVGGQAYIIKVKTPTTLQIEGEPWK